MRFKRKPSIVAIAAAVVIFNFASCKYEDGPNISLRTKKSRLTGEWEAKYVDGERLDNDFQITLEFEKDGDFTLNSIFSFYGQTQRSSSDGEWEWEDNKEKIEVTVDGEKTEWEITRLTNKELEFEDEDNVKWELEKD